MKMNVSMKNLVGSVTVRNAGATVAKPFEKCVRRLVTIALMMKMITNQRNAWMKNLQGSEETIEYVVTSVNQFNSVVKRHAIDATRMSKIPEKDHYERMNKIIASCFIYVLYSYSLQAVIDHFVIKVVRRHATFAM